MEVSSQLNLLDTIDPDLNYLQNNVNDFKSYTPADLCNVLDTNGTLNLMHHNVRSILSEGKLGEINKLLHDINNPFHIIAFTETWLCSDNFDQAKFDQFEHIYKIRPTDNQFDMKNRGVGYQFSLGRISITKHGMI